MAKENVRFFAIFLLIPIYFLLAMTYIEKSALRHIKKELFSTARQTFLHLHQNKDNQSPIRLTPFIHIGGEKRQKQQVS